MGVVDDIKERLDITEVISASVQLQKAGRNFKANCPFHSEKTPSFYVFPDSQRWHCFGACGEGGDVFSFLMKREGWDFRTTLEELARRTGVELRPLTPAQAKREEEGDQLRSALADANAYYHNLFLNSKEAEGARAYIEGRGLVQETIEQFQLGYSLQGWDGLRSYLLGRGFTAKELVDAGLLIEREDGTLYDRFRGRLMIPIRNARGDTIGFGARTLDPEGHPKYINSPQTLLFDKSRTLYGLDGARRAIRQEDRVVIVEGYMDVMRAHQEGFRNIVAQMGTALNEAQLRQLQRYTKRFVLALDPDFAGLQATLRGLEVAREALEREQDPVFDPRGLIGYEGRLGAEIRVLSLPPGYDPDDLIGSDPDRWTALVEEATPIIEFIFQRLLGQIDRDDAKARSRVVNRMLPLLRDVADPVERESYAQKIARELGLQERTLLSQLHAAEQRSARSQPVGVDPGDAEPASADLERYLLSILLCRSGLLEKVDEALVEMGLTPLQPQDLQHAANRSIFEVWQRMDPRSLESVRESVPQLVDEQLESFLEEQELADEQLMREAVRAVLRLRKHVLKQRGLALQMLIEDSDWDQVADSVGETVRENARALLQVEQALARR